ncbi:hypothetical protein [Cupriavidus sp. USMAA2-4]|uniref:hypothetical protein n=1 Tax=Cupriavidus sp. USMAA2-4 TaxID=876364 RepID=UPI0018DD67AE|nr:hypothetical protein [Cupriavidus sp. USMAA2-4]
MQQLLVHEIELAFRRDDAISVYTSAPDAFRPFFDVARNALDAYGDKPVPFCQEAILPGIQAVPLPATHPAMPAICSATARTRCWSGATSSTSRTCSWPSPKSPSPSTATRRKRP